MKPFTYTKLVKVTTNMPTITFVPMAINLDNRNPYKHIMAYVARFNDLTPKDYMAQTGLNITDLRRMLNEYVKETFGLRHGGSIKQYVYSAEDLGMPQPPLPKHLEDEQSFKEWLNKVISDK